MDIPHLCVLSLAKGLWSCFSFFTIISNVVVNIHMSLWAHIFSFFLGRYQRVGFLVNVNLCVLFEGNCHIVQTDYTVLHFSQQRIRVTVLQICGVCHWLSSRSSRCIRYFTVVLICLSLMTDDAQHPFLGLSSLCKSGSGNVYSNFCLFFNWVVSLLSLEFIRVPYVFWV